VENNHSKDFLAKMTLRHVKTLAANPSVALETTNVLGNAILASVAL